MSTPRKITKFEECEKHGAWFAGESRYRRAECYLEGGPGGESMSGGCRGGLCRIWPGRDFFVAEICTGEYELDWTRAKVPA